MLCDRLKGICVGVKLWEVDRLPDWVAISVAAWLPDCATLSVGDWVKLCEKPWLSVGVRLALIVRVAVSVMVEETDWVRVKLDVGVGAMDDVIEPVRVWLCVSDPLWDWDQVKV